MLKHLTTQNDNGILWITINREDKMNALNIALLSELKTVVAQVYNDKNIKGAILTGSGEKAFAAGADIAEFAAFTEDQGKEMAANGHAIFNAIETCPKPFIALVNGFALGGGCELCMSCHIRVATENAKFGQPEVNLGVIPGYGGTQRLIQLIGKGKAFELLMTADMITAQEALRLGLANHVLPNKDGAGAKCVEIIEKISKKAPLAIQKIVEAVDAYFAEGVNGFEKEIDLFASCMITEDFVEGTTAFVEKRKASFQGK